jgi:hypothetical protein
LIVMLEVRGSRELLFDDGTFLTAASGIVSYPDADWVISDEWPVVGHFRWNVEHIPVLLSDEQMPADPLERKAVKPDCEAIARLPGGALLVLGSGSTPRRERGWILGAGPPEEISLSGLYAQLRRDLADLNIEGATLAARTLWLAQRGNGAAGINALVEIVMRGGFELRGVREVRLPEVAGVPLSLTDVAPWRDDQLLFTAVAEQTNSTYLDGECVGAAVGILVPRTGEVLALELLPEPWKVEGVSYEGGLRMVVDPDDPTRPGLLLEAAWTP